MEAIAQQWNFMRILRLVVGIWGIYSSITDSQPLFGILGGVFILQSLLNVECNICHKIEFLVDLPL